MMIKKLVYTVLLALVFSSVFTGCINNCDVLTEQELIKYLDESYKIRLDISDKKIIVYFSPMNDEIEYSLITTDNNNVYRTTEYNVIYLEENDINVNIHRIVVQGYNNNDELVEEREYENVMFYDIKDKTDLSELIKIAQMTEYLYVIESENFQKEISLSQISKLGNLKVIDFKNSINTVNIKNISKLPNLVSLKIGTFEEIMPVMREIRVLEIGFRNSSDDVLCMETGFSDLSALKKMNKLQELTIYINQMKNFDDFKNLYNLRKLRVDYCTELENVGGLAGLENLEEIDLKIRHCTIDINGFSQIPNLRELSISGSNVFYPVLSDWDALGKLTQIEYLSLQTYKGDIDSISSLANLKKLSLSGYYDDIDGLTGMKNLQELGLGGEILNIDAIASLENLETLSLSFYSIGGVGNQWFYEELIEKISIDAIGELKQLKKLYVGSTIYIESLEPISRLDSLTELNFGSYYSNGGLKDISFLIGLNELESLGLRVDDNCDISPIFSLVSLKKLRIVNGEGKYDFSEMTNLEDLTFGYR